MLVLLASRPETYSAILVAIAFASALFAKVVMLLRTRVIWRELLLGAGLLLVLAWIDFQVMHFPANWVVVTSLLGLVGLALLAIRVIWWQGEDRRTAVLTLVPSLFFLASGWSGPALLNFTSRAQPHVLDLYLLSFDASLHLQLPFTLGQAFSRYSALSFLGVGVYVGLPIILGLVYAGCLVSDRRSALPAFLAIVLAGPIGVIFYNLFPAVGPIYVFRDMFPWRALTIDQIQHLVLQPINSNGYRNAMPSLHTTWVLIAFWYARRLSILEKLFAGFFLIATLVATLGTGEHYLVDLIVAVPFAIFVLSLTSSIASRDFVRLRAPITISLLMTLAWLLALRFCTWIFWLSPIIPWTACAVTLAIAFLVARRLLDFQNRPSGQPVLETIHEVATS